MRKSSQTMALKAPLASLFSAEKSQAIEYAIAQLAKKGVSTGELTDYIGQRNASLQIPVAVFANEQLAPLQSLVKYLKENVGYPNQLIARLLGRSQKTIWQTYADACAQHQDTLTYSDARESIPLSLFSPTSLTVFEQLTIYLKEENSRSYHEIGQLLKRNERTIWTVYHRAIRKQGEQA